MERQDIRPGVYSRALEITWLTIIFLIPLFFNPESHQIVAISKASLLLVMVMAMLAFCVADWMQSPNSQGRLNWRSIFTSPLHLSILTFGLLAVLATAASITPAISFWGSWDRKSGLLILICWILFFLIVAQQLRHRAQLFRAAYALLLSSGVVSALGILQYFAPDGLYSLFHSTYNGRVFSTIGNPLFLSCFLAMVIPFNLALIVYSWSKRTSTCHPERQRRVSKPSARLTTSQILRSLRSRFFASLRMTGGNTEQSSHNRGKWANTIRLIGLVILLALQFWCLWLAQYSITILLYIIATIIFITLLGWMRRKRLVLGLGAASFIVLAVLAGVLLAQLLFPIPSIENSGAKGLESVPISEELGLKTLGWRVEYWRNTIDLLLKSPEVPFSNDKLHFLRKAIGYGPETFVVTFQLFFPDKMKSSSTHISQLIDRPHNDYLYLAATMGLLGLMSFLSILAVFFYFCFRCLRRATADIDKLFLIAMVACIIQYMADIFFNISTISPELVFWLTLAMLPVIGRFISNKEPARAEFKEIIQPESVAKTYVPRTRFFLSLGCAAALIVVGTVIAIRPFLADMYLQKGLGLQAKGDVHAIYVLNGATNIDPGEAAYWYYLGAYSYSVARGVTEEPLKTEVLALATDAHNKARELRPYIAFEYYSLADVYTYWAETGAADKWPIALSLYERASQLFPNNAVILNKWSLALIIKGDLDEARTKIDYAASIDPSWAETSFLSGLLLAKEGENAEAALEITTPIRDNPVNLDYFIDLCSSLAVYDMVRPLDDILKPYAQTVSDEWIPHAMLGVTNLFVASPDKSLDEFNTAMRSVPSNDAGGLFRAILRLSSMSPELKKVLPTVAAEWREKLSQSPERDTLLPALDQLMVVPK